MFSLPGNYIGDAWYSTRRADTRFRFPCQEKETGSAVRAADLRTCPCRAPDSPLLRPYS